MSSSTGKRGTTFWGSTPSRRTFSRHAGSTRRSLQRVSVADLRQPLSHPDASFDFVLCNAVIQHITPDIVLGVTLPGLARLLKANGVLQLMFKVGSGIATVYDKDYGADRTFQLYGLDEVTAILSDHGLSVIPVEEGKLGGVMYFTDPKPMDHCVLFARKVR